MLGVLCLISSRSRTLFGKTNYNKPSRFISEIPEELIEEQQSEPAPQWGTGVGQELKKEKRRTDMQQSRMISGRPQQAADTGAYYPGMRVSHKRFGEGMIINVTPMGADNLLEVAFDTVGTKKLMANYANLRKL